MNYKIYKLRFSGAVHLGQKSLEDGEYTFCADTLFSALCQEALKRGEDMLQQFYRTARSGRLLLSDAFPYIGGAYYLPKPMKRIETADNRGDSRIKKAYKKLKYIPMEALDTYLSGNYDIFSAQTEDIERLGTFEMKNVAAVRGEEETRPYRIGAYYYNEGNGLYVIAGYEEQDGLALSDQLMESLSFSGIGGKRASGLGRFELLSESVPEAFCKRLEGSGTRYMSLSVSLPRDDELEAALAGAEYMLCKRSGFVASDRYAPQQMRKRDLFVLKAGACVATKYHGDIYDVSGGGGRHPVYRYAKPMFMEVDA
ncbi:MAG: type III-A CRISPR-associated RAMP protein Csm4 [Roseburia sp.]|nr:type III-A CRISPR-associated RAMP protein Csm4 [Roseburia sp.]